MKTLCRNFVIILITLSFFPLVSLAQRRLDLSNYVLTWSDEFNYNNASQAANRTQMEAKWYFQPSYGVGIDAVQGSITKRENVEVHDGMLHLLARQETNPIVYNGTSYGRTMGFAVAKYDQDYPCSMTNSLTNPYIVPSFHYGIFEIRAKLPGTDGAASAFWFWSGYWQCANANSALSCDPGNISGSEEVGTGFEIDVFEHKHQNNTDIFWSTVQANKLQSPSCKSCATHYDWKNSNPTQTFHTYTMAWTPTSVTFFIDGNEVRTQTDGIPPGKMDLILSNATWGMGQAAPFVVDYVRVYRPAGINYTATKNYSSIIPSGYGPYIWDALWATDATRDAYRNAYATSPYLSNEGYRFAGSASGISTPTATAVYNDASGNSTMYVTQGDNSLKSVYYPAGYTGVNGTPTVSGDYLLNASTKVHPSSTLATDRLTGDVYWRGTDSRLWRRTLSGVISSIDATLSYPNLVLGEIAVAPTNSYHPTRLYYLDFNQTLCYYEWNSTLSKWMRHSTQLTNISDYTVVQSSGKLIYKRTNGAIGDVWGYTDPAVIYNNATPTTWAFADFWPTAGDCADNLIDLPTGGFCYRNTTNGLTIWHWSPTAGWSWSVHALGNVKGNIRARNNNGRTEIFYIGTDDKVHTYYERPAPLLNGQKLWQHSTLDVLSLATSTSVPYQSAYKVRNALEISATSPAKVFCTTQDNKTGAYIGGTAISLIKDTPAGNPYVVCSSENSWHNGYEGRPTPVNSLKNGNPEVILYPNPVSDNLNLETAEVWRNGKVEVLDVNGKIVYQTDNNASVQLLDLSTLRPGTYLVMLRSSNGAVWTGKIAKQ